MIVTVRGPGPGLFGATKLNVLAPYEVRSGATPVILAPLSAEIEIDDAPHQVASSQKVTDLFVVDPLSTPAHQFGRLEIVGTALVSILLTVTVISLVPPCPSEIRSTPESDPWYGVSGVYVTLSPAMEKVP